MTSNDERGTDTRHPGSPSQVTLLQVALGCQQSQNVTGSLALVQSWAQLAHFQIWDTQPPPAVGGTQGSFYALGMPWS